MEDHTFLFRPPSHAPVMGLCNTCVHIYSASCMASFDSQRRTAGRSHTVHMGLGQSTLTAQRRRFFIGRCKISRIDCSTSGSPCGIDGASRNQCDCQRRRIAAERKRGNVEVSRGTYCTIGAHRASLDVLQRPVRQKVEATQ